MIKSMTAFSRCTKSSDIGTLTIELHSVNRRHLEIQTLIPREFLELDAWIKKTVQAVLSRGHVQLSLVFAPHLNFKTGSFEPNTVWAQQIQKAWTKLASDLQLSQPESGLEKLLVRDSQLFSFQMDPEFIEQVQPLLKKVLSQALDQLVEGRRAEGKHLQKELLLRVEKLDALLKKVRSLHQLNVHGIKDRLKERLDKLLDQALIEDERLLKEAAYLADKCDIAEEMTRIEAHLKQFEATLSKEQQGHGKMLDFISQELNREWNTIASKNTDSEIAAKVLEAKSECEKIREQIHNIE